METEAAFEAKYEGLESNIDFSDPVADPVKSRDPSNARASLALETSALDFLPLTCSRAWFQSKRT